LNNLSENIDRTMYPAGNFSTWLRSIRKALTENRGMKVPCGECTACCRSSYFIHINAEEVQTLRGVPKDLLFQAPVRPQGHMVLGYDERGCCPLLVKNKCSIYRDRPATCRSFDCRILASSGLAWDGAPINLLFQKARRWKFNCPARSDSNLLSAVQDAAKFLANHPDLFKDKFTPWDGIQISVLAIKVYDVFLKTNASPNEMKKAAYESSITKEILKSYKKFEKGIRTPSRGGRWISNQAV
jgi:uncharacterized protein